MENRLESVGTLDTLVTVQKCTISTGSQGQKKYTFADYSKVFAHVERDNTELVDYKNLESGQTLTVTVYKISSMTTRWRIIIDSKPYEITAIDPISRFSPLCTLTVEAIDGD